MSAGRLTGLFFKGFGYLNLLIGRLAKTQKNKKQIIQTARCTSLLWLIINTVQQR